MCPYCLRIAKIATESHGDIIYFLVPYAKPLMSLLPKVWFERQEEDLPVHM